MPALDLTFSALSDPTRRAILTRLRRGPATINQLASRFPISQQAVSKHVAVLRKAGLIQQRRVGRERTCSLRARPMRQAARWIESYRAIWEDRFEKLDHHLESRATRA